MKQVRGSGYTVRGGVRWRWRWGRAGRAPSFPLLLVVVVVVAAHDDGIRRITEVAPISAEARHQELDFFIIIPHRRFTY